MVQCQHFRHSFGADWNCQILLNFHQIPYGLQNFSLAHPYCLETFDHVMFLFCCPEGLPYPISISGLDPCAALWGEPWPHPADIPNIVKICQLQRLLCVAPGCTPRKKTGEIVQPFCSTKLPKRNIIATKWGLDCYKIGCIAKEML